MACDIITWSNGVLLLALVANLTCAIFALRTILSVRRTQKMQAELANELEPLHHQLQTARDLFIALCAQSFTVGQWPHIQIMAMLRAKAVANAALQYREDSHDG